MAGACALFGKETRQKFFVFVAGCLVLLFSAEAGLRIYGFTVARMRVNQGLKIAGAGGKTRILCIGESMTFNGYPQILQNLLDSAYPERFEVIDAAIVGNNSSATLYSLEKDLDRYSPQLAIAMLGCNDNAPYRVLQTPAYQTPIGRLFKNLRIYRFFHYLYELLIKTPLHQDIAQLKRFPFVLWNKPSNGTETTQKIEQAINKRDFSTAQQLLLKLPESEKNAKTYLTLGNVYHWQGKWAEGKNAFEKAVALEPKNEEALSRLIGVYIEVTRDYHKADEHLSRAEDLYPNSYNIRYLRALLQLTVRDWTGGLAALKKAISLDPRQPQAWIQLGNAQRYLGHTKLAEQSFEKALELDAGFGNAYAGLAEIYSAHYRNKEALRRLGLKMNKALVSDAAPYAKVADFAAAIGLHTEAEQLFKKALSINPDDPETHTLYGRYLADIRKNPKEALIHFQAAARASTQFRVFYGNLILAKERMGDRDETLLRNEADDKAPELLVRNYRKIHAIMNKRGIPLFAMQYPMRRLHALEEIFFTPENLFFISNENFFQLVKENGYSPYFKDMFAGDFGHCTELGNRMIAENAARAILMAVSHN